MADIIHRSAPNRPARRGDKPHVHPWAEHILDDPRIAYLIAWTVFLLTLAWFAVAPVW